MFVDNKSIPHEHDFLEKHAHDYNYQIKYFLENNTQLQIRLGCKLQDILSQHI